MLSLTAYTPEELDYIRYSGIPVFGEPEKHPVLEIGGERFRQNQKNSCRSPLPTLLSRNVNG